jgi:ubiquinone/menaquinone biosynthesis C-methylase UbiE
VFVHAPFTFIEKICTRSLPDYHRLHVAVPIVEGTADKMPFESGTFDVVSIAQAFHWFANHASLAEVYRVLKPGGSIDCASRMPSSDFELTQVHGLSRPIGSYLECL